MILDTLNNFKHYVSLNPYFKKVEEFLASNNLAELPIGKHIIDGDNVFVNIVDSPAKPREEAKLETHIEMIDIQIPLSADETHGYTPLSSLPEAAYDKANDITFYEGQADNYFTLHPGEFVIYFPQDAHAPAITPVVLRKAIFKVRVE